MNDPVTIERKNLQRIHDRNRYLEKLVQQLEKQWPEMTKCGHCGEYTRNALPILPRE